jgi:hypothetical protein
VPKWVAIEQIVQCPGIFHEERISRKSVRNFIGMYFFGKTFIPFDKNREKRKKIVLSALCFCQKEFSPISFG